MRRSRGKKNKKGGRKITIQQINTSGDFAEESSEEEQQRIFIFYKMKPADAEAILIAELANNSNAAAWLIRESREDGMVTIQCITRDQLNDREYMRKNRDPGKRCWRFALTKEGWVGVGHKSITKIKKKMKTAVTVENASQHVDSLLKNVMRERHVSVEEQAIPKINQQAQNNLYIGYTQKMQASLSSSFGSGELRLVNSRDGRSQDAVFTSDGLVRSQDLKLGDSRGDVGEEAVGFSNSSGLFAARQNRPLREIRPNAIINIPEEFVELDRLIRDPVPRRGDGGDVFVIMTDPVTFLDGTTYDRTTVENNPTFQHTQEGVDYFPNHTLRNLIRHITACFAENVDRETKIRLLESASNEVLDPVMFEPMDDPVLLRTGHCINRPTLQGMVESGRTLRDPNTRTPIVNGEEITESTMRRIIDIFPRVRERIAADNDLSLSSSSEELNLRNSR